MDNLDLFNVTTIKTPRPLLEINLEDVSANGYDGCGAHTHSMVIGASSKFCLEDNVRAYLKNCGLHPQLQVAIEPIELPSIGNQSLYTIVVKASNEKLYQLFTGRKLDEAKVAAENLKKRLEALVMHDGFKAEVQLII